MEGRPDIRRDHGSCLCTDKLLCYPHSLWLKIAGYGLVAYTMYEVSSFDIGSMHWFSDAVAGALMAYTIGSTVDGTTEISILN